MLKKYLKVQLLSLVLLLMLQKTKVSCYKGNYEAKYTKADIPLWKQRACEKSQKYKANSHYICDDKGDVKCLPGWQGDLCQVPMCRKGCDPMNGYCQRPGECRCRIGYTGELCDKCIPLPGCQHGECTKPFECICLPGWDGLFCTEPTCRSGCHSTRGYCEAPGECRCRIGWAGRNCSDCSVLPGCQHGTCSKPLECQCLPGYTGLLCQTPICNADCDKQHGYCRKPGECRCKVGWFGANCDKCFPYPGCVNGDCEKPWECNCKSGWGGILCDEALSYCKEHPNICQNKGKCISLTKDEGSYRCHCQQGYWGRNCEIIDEFLLTSTAAPRITPPPLSSWLEEDEADSNAALTSDDDDDDDGEDHDELKKNVTLNEIKTFKENEENITLNLNISNSLENVIKINESRVPDSNITSPLFPLKSGEFKNIENKVKHQTGKTNKILKQTNKTKIFYAEQNTSPTTIAISIKSLIGAINSTTISPFSKLEDEKNLLNIPLKQMEANNKKTQANEGEGGDEDDDDDEDDDEECTDDNDDECEYVDEDDEDDSEDF